MQGRLQTDSLLVYPSLGAANISWHETIYVYVIRRGSSDNKFQILHQSLTGEAGDQGTSAHGCFGHGNLRKAPVPEVRPKKGA